MSSEKYNDLKRRCDALIQENKELKAKLQKLASQSGHLHHNSIQSTERLFGNMDQSASNRQSDLAITDESYNSDNFITMSSPNHAKIALFMSLFRSRTDVYAKKWQNKKGVSGYSPVCLNEWTPGICNKPKVKCSKCNNQAYASLDASAIEKHLRGDIVVGVYPMYPDETCHFLAIDFDDKGWDNDIEIIRNSCSEFNIPIALERSQSGNGCHAWFFFEERISAALARKFGTSLLTHSMRKRYEITFKSYDRLFPNQDTLPKGGFGNLIALPLQKNARENDNSVFLDERFQSYEDQWLFFSEVKKLNENDLRSFIPRLTQGDELGMLKVDESESKPWMKQKSIELKKYDFPESIRMVKSGMLYIEKTGLSPKALHVLKRYSAIKNPEFYKAQAMRLSTFGKPRVISCSDDYEHYLALPRGCGDDVKSLLKKHNVELIEEDQSSSGKLIDVEFRGELRDEQQTALDALTEHENGVLAAAPAFGKTVVGAKLIGMKKVNTLVLVHRRQLLSQWRERLNQFLIINESLPALPKRKGPKRKQDVIGYMAGGRNRLSSIVDVVVMQSVHSKGAVNEVMENYGMILVDECHHVPAVTFEHILKKATAKYIYGLTATPFRQDGLHPIIFFYCGSVRFSVDAMKEAQNRPFDHYLVPRLTAFKIPAESDGEAMSLQEIKTCMVSDALRNKIIVDDVLSCYAQGRKSLILTGRVGHVTELAERLKRKISNVFCLTGGMSAKETAHIMEKIIEIDDQEPFVLVATGSYIGEGFDEARLDTLFLAMPIAWKGTLQQYAGRLHRLCEGKTDVRIYDYVDVYVKMLEKMYGKRLKGYASIGYKAKVEAVPEAPTHIIFNQDNFFSVYVNDIAAASKQLMVVSPFVTQRRIAQMIHHFRGLANKQVKTTVLTRPVEDYQEERRAVIEKLFVQMHDVGVQLVFKSKIHQKFAIIDHRITWYGSINLLGFGYSEESMMRLESSRIASELLDSVTDESFAAS